MKKKTSLQHTPLIELIPKCNQNRDYFWNSSFWYNLYLKRIEWNRIILIKLWRSWIVRRKLQKCLSIVLTLFYTLSFILLINYSIDINLCFSTLKYKFIAIQKEMCFVGVEATIIHSTSHDNHNMSSSDRLPFVLAVFHFVLQNTSRFGILCLLFVYIKYTLIWKNHIYSLLNARFISSLSFAKCYINISLYQCILT